MRRSLDWEKLFSIVLIALLLLSIIIVINNNIYHGELDIYFPHYLNDLPLKKIIFDPICELDLTRSYFRGRELGNFFNFLDYRIVLLLFVLKIPAFISTINYLCWIIIAIFTISQAKRYPIICINYVYLSLIILFSSSPVLFSGTLYRTNKIIASLGIFLSIGLIAISFIRESTNNTKRKHLIYVGIYLSSLLACASDEQGVVFIALIFLTLIYVRIFLLKFSFIKIFAVLLGLISYILYVKFIGIWLFENINGITPLTTGVDFQEILNLRNYFNSINLFLRYSISLFGNFYYFGIFGSLMYAFVFIFFTYRILKNLSFSSIYKIKIIILIILVLLYITFIIHVMTLKHTAIFWKDIFTYYSLPIIIVLYSGFLFAIYNFLGSKGNKIAYFFFIILIVGNIISIKHYKKIFRDGHLKYFMTASTVINSVDSNSNNYSKLLLGTIKLKGEVSGARDDMKYGEEGVRILRKRLNKEGDQ